MTTPGGPSPPGFNWLGLAEAAGWDALHRAGDVTEALAWARVARAARERLVADAGGYRYEAWRARLGDDNLRAELIVRYGSVRGDPFLDCDELFRSFLARHDAEFDEVARDCGRWPGLPIERIRDLRYIKNELNVLRRLDRCERFADPAVQRWLALWPQLP
jgi:hypothetical protein